MKENAMINLPILTILVLLDTGINDKPGLTENCKIIAYSEACPRQIIENTGSLSTVFNAIWSLNMNW
jgi:hypothetical protein